MASTYSRALCLSVSYYSLQVGSFRYSYYCLLHILFPPFCRSVSLSPSVLLCLSVSVCPTNVCPTFCMSLFYCLSMPISVCLPVSVFLSLSFCHSSLSFVSVCSSVCLSVCLSLYFCLCLHLSLSVCLASCLFLSFRLCFCVPLFVYHFCLGICMSVITCLSFFMSMFFYLLVNLLLYTSVSVLVFVCLSLHASVTL